MVNLESIITRHDQNIFFSYEKDDDEKKQYLMYKIAINFPLQNIKQQKIVPSKDCIVHRFSNFHMKMCKINIRNFFLKLESNLTPYYQK